MIAPASWSESAHDSADPLALHRLNQPAYLSRHETRVLAQIGTRRATRQLRNRRQGCHDPDDRDGCLGTRPQYLTRDRHDGPRADDASGDRPVAPIRLGRAVARDIRRPGSPVTAGAWP